MDFLGDTDYWEFDATNGTTYRIQVDPGNTVRNRDAEGNTTSVDWALNTAIYGLYYDHPDYDPESTTNEVKLHEQLVTNGTLTTANNIERNVSPVAWSRGGNKITYEFTAGNTGKYFFGVRKAWTTSWTDKNARNTFNVSVTEVTP